MTRARFLFLSSASQRLRRDGRRQPHRLYLADGTELPLPAEITVAAEFQIMDITRWDDEASSSANGRQVRRVTLTFDEVELRTITQKPKRRAAR